MTVAGGARAVFVDRDGTLIEDVGYLRHPGEMRVLPGVPEGLLLLRGQGFKIVLTTNQSGVARGYFSEQELGRVHLELERKLGAFDGLYYCPHHPTEGSGEYRRVCDCRKPKAGMIRRACTELGLDPGRCYVVGDQMIDMGPAAEVGAQGILLTGEPPKESVPRVVMQKSFQAAAQWIVRDLSRSIRREEIPRAAKRVRR